MAAMKVHGTPLSTATQRVLVCLHEKELDFEFVLVNMKEGEHKKEPFISQLNPFGQVPAFQHEDLTIFESRAITQYIAHSFPDKGIQLLCPGKMMALVSTWIEVEAHRFDPLASKLNWELFFKPLFGLTTDAAVVEENEVQLAKVFDVYEARLAKTKYLACDCYTLADMHHIPNLQLLMGTPMKKLVDCRPHVSAWFADISSRPAWAKVLAFSKSQ